MGCFCCGLLLTSEAGFALVRCIMYLCSPGKAPEILRLLRPQGACRISHAIQQHIHPTGLSQVKPDNPILSALGSFNWFARWIKPAAEAGRAGAEQSKIRSKAGILHNSPLCWKNDIFGNGTCSSHIPVSTAD